MMRALAVAATIATLTGCGAIVQHPVPALAVVGAAIGFGSCEMDQVGAGTCGIVGASTGVFMGGVAALVYLLTDQPPPQMEGDEVEPDQRVHRHHAPVILPPPPEPEPAPPEPAVIDAGVPAPDAP